ncbi:hypothetical protein BX659_14615 [Orenia metallireducens]|uniref:Uncharacterized protein n=1 Tax=Orenia metallireducens TaxID=1413210 RepID=A0A285IGK0_9FIRM|nr:hypothetical protein [Orenia metallireducens]PRX18109.1 hypothetical protein BX659_14615 [Orenia metallireducens]SNY47088.1 hypothetical protein SAMN06265827_14715 [Orenia metallireducens]
MITETDPAKWWEAAYKIIIEPIEIKEDNNGNRYTPIEDVKERLNLIFGPFWDVKIDQQYYEERTYECIVKGNVTFRTPQGIPDISKDAIGRFEVVKKKKDRDGNEAKSYQDREIKSLGDAFESAKGNMIKRAAEDLELGLRMRFANPALNEIMGGSNSSNNDSSNNQSKGNNGNQSNRAGDDPGEIKLPFGKHQGTKLKDIDSDYLKWVVQNANKDKYKIAAQRVLESRDTGKQIA